MRLETHAAAFRGAQRVTDLELAAGEEIAANVYVAATGGQPVVDFLDGADVDVSWGVVVDDRLRSNLPDVYAAGDVEETRDRMTGKRYVHAIFPNAVALRRTPVGQLGRRLLDPQFSVGDLVLRVPAVAA